MQEAHAGITSVALFMRNCLIDCLIECTAFDSLTLSSVEFFLVFYQVVCILRAKQLSHDVYLNGDVQCMTWQ
jgi:hypothetical protein